jgi:hypothetical protein
MYNPKGARVHTCFGHGEVTAVRVNTAVYEVKLDRWMLANGRSPTLYLNGNSLEYPILSVGSMVYTSYGTGEVVSKRVGDSIIVRPATWKLAFNSTPLFYLRGRDVRVMYTGNPNTFYKIIFM